MTADSLIRKKVNRLQAEQRQTYPTFLDALLEVLNNHKYLWNDARAKAVLQKVDKKKEDLEPTTDQVVDSPPRGSPNDRKKRQRAKNKELLREAKAARSVQKPHFEKSKGGGKSDKVDKDKRIPDSEWKIITSAASKVTGPKRCHYFNSSMGCGLGDKCRFKHQCMVCGAGRTMVGNH